MVGHTRRQEFALRGALRRRDLFGIVQILTRDRRVQKVVHHSMVGVSWHGGRLGLWQHHAGWRAVRIDAHARRWRQMRRRWRDRHGRLFQPCALRACCLHRTLSRVARRLESLVHCGCLRGLLRRVSHGLRRLVHRRERRSTRRSRARRPLGRVHIWCRTLRRVGLRLVHSRQSRALCREARGLLSWIHGRRLNRSRRRIVSRLLHLVHSLRLCLCAWEHRCAAVFIGRRMRRPHVVRWLLRQHLRWVHVCRRHDRLPCHLRRISWHGRERVMESGLRVRGRDTWRRRDLCDLFLSHGDGLVGRLVFGLAHALDESQDLGARHRVLSLRAQKRRRVQRHKQLRRSCRVVRTHGSKERRHGR